MSDHPDTPEFDRLLAVIRRLRAPGGCPWDREQTEASMAPHLLEETFEAVDAIRAGDADASCEELGDVLMNVLMIAQIAAEAGRFGSEDVARTIADKLIRRHPHVFGDVQARDSEQVLRNWERIKQTERDKAESSEPAGLLDGLPADLPALLLAFRLGEKAGRVGFDWPDPSGPRAKLDEELRELDDALAQSDAKAIEAELGDLLFSVANLARHHGVNPEMALRDTAIRFRRRFAHVERTLGSRLRSAPLEEKEQAWSEAKERENRAADS